MWRQCRGTETTVSYPPPFESWLTECDEVAIFCRFERKSPFKFQSLWQNLSYVLILIYDLPSKCQMYHKGINANQSFFWPHRLFACHLKHSEKNMRKSTHSTFDDCCAAYFCLLKTIAINPVYFSVNINKFAVM